MPLSRSLNSTLANLPTAPTPPKGDLAGLGGRKILRFTTTQLLVSRIIPLNSLEKVTEPLLKENETGGPKDDQKDSAPQNDLKNINNGSND
jgi:hypothetical protein